MYRYPTKPLVWLTSDTNATMEGCEVSYLPLTCDAYDVWVCVWKWNIDLQLHIKTTTAAFTTTRDIGAVLPLPLLLLLLLLLLLSEKMNKRDI